MVDDEEGGGFAWAPEEFDRQTLPFVGLLVELRAAQYAAADRAAGRPLRSRAQAELDELQVLLEARQLRAQATAGDEEALRSWSGRPRGWS